MRRFVAMMTAAILLLMLSPCAFARSVLERPGEGQVIFVDADNDTDYQANFPLVSLKAAERRGDDLIIELPAARIVLSGFFKPLGEWRSLSFSDGSSIGGADFDSEGAFTGVFSSAEQFERSSSAVSLPAAVLTAELSQYGVEILMDGQAVYGELRDACSNLLERLYPLGRPDWRTVQRLWFEFTPESDGSLRPSRSRTIFTNGLSVSVVNPAVLCVSDSLSLMPLSEGRAAVSYENALGLELLSLNVRCQADGSGGLSLSSLCPGCGGTQGGKLHYLICGHYGCQEGYDAVGHGAADCGYAGHCAAEGDHSLCKNCREPVCNGQNHGYGQCQHVHNWMPISVYTSRCVVCNYEYTSPAKSAG